MISACRVFSTETVNGGLPIHIAAKLLGHLDLNTTQGYVAVYPEEVINHYRRFVDQRRTQRPSEEYREPTDTEREEFRDHFRPSSRTWTVRPSIWDTMPARARMSNRNDLNANRLLTRRSTVTEGYGEILAERDTLGVSRFPCASSVA